MDEKKDKVVVGEKKSQPTKVKLWTQKFIHDRNQKLVKELTGLATPIILDPDTHIRTSIFANMNVPVVQQGGEPGMENQRVKFMAADNEIDIDTMTVTTIVKVHEGY